MFLPSLRGNERIKRALSGLSKSNFGSAVIVEGPALSGKKTLAVDIAFALLCRAEAVPCGVCPSCVKMRAGSHPDFKMINPDGEDIKVDDVRALRALSFVKANESDLKVYALNAADKMNVQAQNALLKILEEPQAAVFILLCENRELLLPTVRSRCRLFRMDEPPQARTEGTKASECADGLLKSLGKGELNMVRACLDAGRLSREEYTEFCDEACKRLSEALKNKCYDSRLMSIYDYIVSQRGRLVLNASVSSLSGALAAFCGQLYSA